MMTSFIFSKKGAVSLGKENTVVLKIQIRNIDPETESAQAPAAASRTASCLSVMIHEAAAEASYKMWYVTYVNEVLAFSLSSFSIVALTVSAPLSTAMAVPMNSTRCACL